MLRWILATVALCAFWVLLTEGALASLLIGIPAIAFALWLSQRQAFGWSLPIDLVALARFVPYFLWHSIRGAAQVAACSLQSKAAVNPTRLAYATRLQSTAARTFFAYCINLLPGSLTLSIEAAEIEVHCLNAPDAEQGSHALQELENRVAEIFPSPATQAARP